MNAIELRRIFHRIISNWEKIVAFIYNNVQQLNKITSIIKSRKKQVAAYLHETLRAR